MYVYMYYAYYICIYVYICIIMYYYVTSDSHCPQCLRIDNALLAVLANRLRNARSV